MVTTTGTNLRERAIQAYQEAEARRAAAIAVQSEEIARDLREKLATKMSNCFNLFPGDVVVGMDDDDLFPRSAATHIDGMAFSVTTTSNSLWVEPVCVACGSSADFWSFSNPPSHNWVELGRLLHQFEQLGGRCVNCRTAAAS